MSSDRAKNDIDELMTVALHEKVKALEDEYKEMLKKNEELVKQNLKIQKITKRRIENICVPTTSIIQTKSNINQTNSQSIPFAAHENEFLPAQLHELRSMTEGKRKDGPFVAKCLEFLYKGDLKIIGNKVSGKRKLKGKSTITPQKRSLMESMLNERFESEGVDEKILVDRSERLTRLIGDGIQNLTRRKASSIITDSTTTTVPASTILATTRPASITPALAATTAPAPITSAITTAITPATFNAQPFDAFTYVQILFFNY